MQKLAFSAYRKNVLALENAVIRFWIVKTESRSGASFRSVQLHLSCELQFGEGPGRVLWLLVCNSANFAELGTVVLSDGNVLGEKDLSMPWE